MNSANDGQKIEDPEKQILHAKSTLAGRPPYLGTSTLEAAAQSDAKSKKMMKLQHICFSLLLMLLLTLTFVSGSGVPRRHAPTMSEEERLRFQELLNTVEPASLHDVLHKHLKDRYQHGVYQEDKAAMEVVAQSDSEVAHSLIELAKRQASNTTTTVAVVTTTTAVTTDIPSATTTIAVLPPSTTPGMPTSPTVQTTTPQTTQTQPTQSQQSQAPGTTTTPTTPTTMVQNPGTTPASSGATTPPTKTGTSNGTLRRRQLVYLLAPPLPLPVTSSVSSSNSTSSAYYPAGNSSSVLATVGPTVYSPYVFATANATAAPSNATNSSIPLMTAAPLYPLTPPPLLSQNATSTIAPAVSLNAINGSILPTTAAPLYPLAPAPLWSQNVSNVSSTAVSPPSASNTLPFANTSSTYCPTADSSSFPNITMNFTSLDSLSSCTTSFFNSTPGASPTNSSSGSQGQGQTSLPSKTSSGPVSSNSAIVQSSSTSNGVSTSVTSIISTSSAQSVTVQTIYTTTLPNGAMSTLTSVTIVPAGHAEETGSATKTNGNGSLQTNAANSMGSTLSGVIGMLGIVVVGAL